MRARALRTVLKRLPGLHRLHRALRGAWNVLRSTRSPFLHRYPAGHFYSPLPAVAEVRRRAGAPLPAPGTLGDLDLDETGQLETLSHLARYQTDLAFPQTPQPSHRYYYRNDFFACGDAVVLAAMLRHLEPARVVEVGSGFSSAVMLDTRDAFLRRRPRFTFIDPYPERLRSLLRHGDQDVVVMARPVQDVPPALFAELGRNDILFVDSSHVVKAASDVATLVFDVLPRLAPGVVVHFHDILWPFEYPLDWIEQGIAWNEAYCVRAFLQYNSAFSILYFNSFMARAHPDAVARALPLAPANPGGSLWLRRR